MKPRRFSERLRQSRWLLLRVAGRTRTRPLGWLSGGFSLRSNRPRSQRAMLMSASALTLRAAFGSLYRSARFRRR